MWIRDSRNFKKIVITSESYSDAFDEMTTEQVIELNQVLKEHMSNWKKYNYNRAFKEYRRKIYRNYIDLLLDGKVTDDEDLWLSDDLNI